MRTIVQLDRHDGTTVGFDIDNNPGAAFLALAGLLHTEADEAIAYALRDNAEAEAIELRRMADSIARHATHNAAGCTVDHAYGWEPNEGGPRPRARLFHVGEVVPRTTGRVLFDDIATIKDALRDAADYRRGEWTDEDRHLDADAESDCATADLYNAVAARLTVEPTEHGTQR